MFSERRGLLLFALPCQVALTPERPLVCLPTPLPNGTVYDVGPEGPVYDVGSEEARGREATPCAEETRGNR